MFGSPTRTRTRDKVVNSHLLYRLSYWGIVGCFKRDELNTIPGFGVSTAFFDLFHCQWLGLPYRQCHYGAASGGSTLLKTSFAVERIVSNAVSFRAQTSLKSGVNWNFFGSLRIMVIMVSGGAGVRG